MGGGSFPPPFLWVGLWIDFIHKEFQRRNAGKTFAEEIIFIIFIDMLRRQPEKIDKVLVRTLKGLKLDGRIKQETILLNWGKTVGERIASRTTPLRVKDSILFVAVENASWRNELIFLKEKIIKQLNHSVKANVIKDIVFTN